MSQLFSENANSNIENDKEARLKKLESIFEQLKVVACYSSSQDTLEKIVKNPINSPSVCTAAAALVARKILETFTY